MRTCSHLFALLGLLLFAAGSAPAQEDATKLKVKEGDKAPDIELPATQPGAALPALKDADKLRLSDLRGKKNVVMFFYPKAMTRGCTIESCGFRDVAEKFAAADTVIVGISTDTLDAQEQFTKKERLNFPLLADDQMKVSKQLGVMSPRGKVTQRVTFIIDKQGTIRKIYTKVSPQDHPQEVLTYVKENLNK